MINLNKLIDMLSRNKVTSIFFLCLFFFIVLLMQNAFKVQFFLDDYFFLKVGKADSLSDVVRFFSPYKDYFYRPVPTEIFYFIINLVNRNLIITHSIVFVTYFLGLIFLYKSSLEISKNKIFSYILTFLYAINFTHVFQLYQVATYIEICLFTFLCGSFYFYIKKRYFLSILFYILALMSKESAVLFPALILLLEVILIRKFDKHFFLRLGLFGILSVIFVLIFKYATSQVLLIDTYKIILEPNLIFNNSMWYFLWAIGVPNFVPNYIQSIFFKPLPDFWNLFLANDIKHFFYSFILFYFILISGFLITFLENNKKIKYLLLIIGLIILFYLFISPTIPTIHRWMVRLTVPLIFISCINAIIIYLLYQKAGFYRLVSIVLLVLYTYLNVMGIKIHESSGLFLLNTQTINNFDEYVKKNKNEIDKFNTIYFVDSSPDENYGGSEEIKNMLGSDYFTDTFFPNQNKKIIYGHEVKIIPEGSFVIKSGDLY